MWDLDAILAIVTKINSKISSQMSPECIAEPANKKTDLVYVWTSLTPTYQIGLHYTLMTFLQLPCTFSERNLQCRFFLHYTQVLIRLQHGAQKHFTELESFSLESNFPCLSALSPALHSLMWSRTLTPVRPEQLQPLRDCHCWAVGIAGLGL